MLFRNLDFLRLHSGFFSEIYNTECVHINVQKYKYKKQKILCKCRIYTHRSIQHYDGWLLYIHARFLAHLFQRFMWAYWSPVQCSLSPRLSTFYSCNVDFIVYNCKQQEIIKICKWRFFCLFFFKHFRNKLKLYFVLIMNGENGYSCLLMNLNAVNYNAEFYRVTKI